MMVSPQTTADWPVAIPVKSLLLSHPEQNQGFAEIGQVTLGNLLLALVCPIENVILRLGVLCLTWESKTDEGVAKGTVFARTGNRIRDPGFKGQHGSTLSAKLSLHPKAIKGQHGSTLPTKLSLHPKAIKGQYGSTLSTKLSLHPKAIKGQYGSTLSTKLSLHPKVIKAQLQMVLSAMDYHFCTHSSCFTQFSCHSEHIG